VRKPLAKCTFGRLRIWEGKIKMDLRETGCEVEMRRTGSG
jgi:hypothetical protein